jgi:hypothetical protein
MYWEVCRGEGELDDRPVEQAIAGSWVRDVIGHYAGPPAYG